MHMQLCDWGWQEGHSPGPAKHVNSIGWEAQLLSSNLNSHSYYPWRLRQIPEFLCHSVSSSVWREQCNLLIRLCWEHNGLRCARHSE
jgi:hypothetical protein